jgi:hypothetical protein
MRYRAGVLVLALATAAVLGAEELDAEGMVQELLVTGVAVAQLAAEGRLDLDDTIAEHLPDFPRPELAQRITLRHLLTHTAGLGSYWNPRFAAKAKQIRRLDEILETFIDEPLLFEPGEGYEYSNSGPVVLGLVIESITGDSYRSGSSSGSTNLQGCAVRSTSASARTPSEPHAATIASHPANRGATSRVTILCSEAPPGEPMRRPTISSGLPRLCRTARC